MKPRSAPGPGPGTALRSILGGEVLQAVGVRR